MSRSRQLRLVLTILAMLGACAPPVAIEKSRAPTRSPAPAAVRRSPAGTATIRDPAGTGSFTANRIAVATNEARADAGLSRLTINRSLMKAAQLQANQMAAASTMAHELPGARYPTLRDRIAAVGYAWRLIGENVARDQSSADDVVEAWMESPRHRANILKPEFTEIGTGYATDSRGRRYYAQVFGRRR